MYFHSVYYGTVCSMSCTIGVLQRSLGRSVCMSLSVPDTRLLLLALGSSSHIIANQHIPSNKVVTLMVVNDLQYLVDKQLSFSATTMRNVTTMN